LSGIAGIVNFDGCPVNPDTLKRMSLGLVHRGPDAAGQRIDGHIAFAHRKLATTPESVSEVQPLLNESGDYCLTLDGRVDNRQELEEALYAKGAVLRENSDAELVMRAYEQWGEDCPAKIIGDFAFAIWDRRKQQLLCARDILGIRPFYYYADDRSFLFASDMQPLFEAPQVERKPNLPLIGLQLSDSFGDQEQTRYANVFRLPPRSILIVRNGIRTKRMYWDVDPVRTIRYRSDAEYAEHFLSIFQESVRSQVRSRGKVGARLSGGLDSSSIVCVAQKLFRENSIPNPGFESFSNVFDGLACDERTYIHDVVEKCGVKANYFSYAAKPQIGDFSEVSRYPDVLYHPVVLMNVPLYRAMQASGVHVVLDGTGGDELLAAGCEHLTDLVSAGRFRETWTQARFASTATQTPIFKLLFNYGLIPFIPNALKPILRPIHRLARRHKPYQYVRPEFLRSVGLGNRPGRRAVKRGFPTRSQERIYEGLFWGWNATVALELMDLFTSRFSLEFRYPFFDRRLIEFLLAIPAEQQWRQDQTKFILRTAMKGILPESVRQRRGKAEFSPVMNAEMTGSLSVRMDEIFDNSVMAEWGILDSLKLVELNRQYQRAPTARDAGQLSFLLGLELWFRSVVQDKKR
jgi:asparagine synthase (glutamine-hydrolysing)